ncbi:MAG: hypothetical protein JW862_08920 [Anaerolineales bacterium]|nr:hypothetical protein [Anaerolineales bacterium]
MNSRKVRLWLGRLLIGAVLAMNLQAAIYFITRPELAAPAYELAGVPGEAAIQGFGVLFLMWNVPYAFAAWNPIRFRISLYQAVLMQTIGLLVESLIYLELPLQHATLRAAILRFILFDGAGLVALLLATAVTFPLKKQGQD